MTKSFNIAPYNDDYDDTKNYMRTLFRPKVAVQARELTQLQTHLTSQASKFASHIFTNGSKVKGADLQLNTNVVALKLDTFGAGASDASDFVGKYIKKVGGGANGFVHKSNGVDQIYVIYRGGEFLSEDSIIVEDVEGDTPPLYTADIQTGSTSVNWAVFAYIDTGIIHIDGNFIIVSPQTILVDADANDGNYYIGVTLLEEEITHNEDQTLYDPAQGVFNVNAPGADRYKITLTLTSYDVGDTLPIDGSFYSLMEVADGKIIHEEKDTRYSNILDMLAKRTYEESGDYTTNPFLIHIEDHDTDTAKLKVVLDPGIGYVKGYRHEKQSKTEISLDKGRDVYEDYTETVFINYGPYILLDRDNLDYMPDPFTFDELNCYSVDKTGSQNANTLLGKVRCTAFVFTGSEFRLYIADASGVAGKVASIRSVTSASGSVPLATELNADTILAAASADGSLPERTELHSSTSNISSIFPMSRKALKTVDTTGVIYKVQAQQSSVTISGGAGSISAGTDEIDQTFKAILIDNATDNILIEGVEYDISYSTTNIYITNATGVTQIHILYGLEKNLQSYNTKTLTTVTNESQTTGAGETSVTLTKTDITEITSVIRDPGGGSELDVTDDVTLDNGQKDFYYDYGTVSGLEASYDYNITYKYFSHSGSGDYFCVDSYSVDMEDIPYYTDSLGNIYHLVDCFDFRRSITVYGSTRSMLTPNRYLVTNYDYYLPRKDLIQMNQEGVLFIDRGISSLSPATPFIQPDSMPLYSLDVPAYTFKTIDVVTQFIENKNYTMRDIGELERRIDGLEYYSSLNMLEQDIMNLEIQDESGNTRFKNGILTDAFMGANVVDPFHSEYWCSIDPDAGIVRTPFQLNQLDFIPNTTVHTFSSPSAGAGLEDTTNNIRKHDHIVTMNYSVVSFIEQLKASNYMNVNPYNVFIWGGNLQLIPNSDNWIDTEYAPDLITNIDGLYDNLIQDQIDAYGTQWGDWKTIWTGVSWSTTPVSLYVWVTETTTTTERQVRTGTRLRAIPNRITRNMGERVIDVSVIPYMRELPIQFEAVNLKPDVNLKIYFDDVDVSADSTYVTPDSGYEPDNAVTHAVKSNSAGKAKGTFTVPNSDTLRFRTGKKLFKIIDDISNPSTWATSDFICAGHLQQKQRSILSIDSPILETVTVEDDRTLTTTDTTTWYEPVAESFLIDKEGGVFISDIEVFFKTKDEVLPVTVYVVETENGYPSQTQVPYARVTLEPADVNISDDSSTGTTFQFTDPVYLENNVEYAFIVFANSDKYNIWYGEIGAFDIEQLPNEERITEQPYAGVMFKSQNASTWTADQTKDIKFNINRCKFQTKTIDVKEGLFQLYHDSNASGTIQWGSDTDESIWATNIQYELDHIAFDLTDVVLSGNFQFTDSATYYDFKNGEEIYLPVQTRVSRDHADSRTANIAIDFFTENDAVSPVFSLERNQCIMINNLIIDDENQQLPYELSTHKDETGYDFNAGTYVTRVTNLINPSDSITVMIDAQKPSGSKVDAYFSIGKYEPTYIEIYDEAVDGKTITIADEELIGKKLYVYMYDSSNSNTIALQTQLLCTDVKQRAGSGAGNQDWIYITGVGDTTKIDRQLSWTDSQNDALFVTEISDMDTDTIDDWSATTTYSDGDFVFHSGYIWESVGGSTDVEPVEYGTAWLRYVYNFICSNTHAAGEEIQTDVEMEWRELKIESQNLEESVAATEYVEYKYIPKGVIEEDFTSFRVKLEMKAVNPVLIPSCSSLRVVATY